MGPFLIVKTGTTVPNVAARRGDFEAFFRAHMGLTEASAPLCNVYDGEPLPSAQALQRFAGVIVTGSPAMVTERLPWSERTALWLRQVVESGVPLLGVCYGHQLLAHAFGGVVANNPQGRNVGTVDVDLTADGVSDVLLGPHAPRLHVPVSHVQAVLALPSGAVRLASTARDPNHAFAIGPRAWGVQFHPEFDADIVRGYITARRDALEREGLDAATLGRAARDTADGQSLLRRFVALASDVSVRSS